MNACRFPEPSWDKHVMTGRSPLYRSFRQSDFNLTAYHIREVRGSPNADPYIRIGGITIDGLVRSYGRVGRAPGALINSNGYVEVFLKEGRAADRLNVARARAIEAQLTQCHCTISRAARR